MFFAITLVATAQAPGPLLASAQGTLKTWGSTAREAAGEALRRIPNPLPGLIPSTPSLPDMATIQASRTALTDIPSSYLARYVVTDRAMTKSCPALTWQLLAAIGKVESDHGRSPAPGVRSGVNRFGCCAGPMQFNITTGHPAPGTPGERVCALTCTTRPMRSRRPPASCAATA